jgi:hypothetical protein
LFVTVVIVIFRLAYSLRRFFATVAFIALPAAAQQLTLSLDSIEHPAFTAQGLNVVLDIFHPGAADISVADVQIGDIHLQDVKLHCDDFRLDETAMNCAKGSLGKRDKSSISFSLNYQFSGDKLELSVRDADIASLVLADKRLKKWHPLGRFDLHFASDSRHAKVDMVLRELSFNTDDYGIAGEHIATHLTADATRDQKQWHWNAQLDWSGGEAFYSPWYRKAGVRITADGVLTPQQLRVDQARVTLDRVGSLTAGLTFERKTAAVSRWGFVTESLDLSAAVKEWVQPVLEAHALPSISATGATRYAAEWANGGMQFFYAGIENATIQEGHGRLTLTGVNASIPWSRTSATDAEVSVGGGTLDDFALGGFRVPVQLNGFDVAIKQLAIPFLDGRVRIEDFHAARPQAEWSGRFSGGVEGVSMPRFTSAIGLPAMAGSLSMKIPAANYANHVLDLGGDLVIDVFDGRVTFRHLKLIEPLGVTSRFVSDVEARRLDLGLLTSTFSFGSILGRLDADINGLELHNWKPLAFRARLLNSAGDYRRAISRGALIDISSLGGVAGAAAARAIPAAGFFNTFRYDRIGVGCTLKDGVCHMDGVRPENNGYVLVEGGGIPSVKVMGYNRDIDWDLLVSRLKAVIAGKVKAVIE